MNLPIKIDVILKYNRQIGIWITTTYDGYYTLWGNLEVEVKIPNHYPRFTTVEKAEEYWNKIKPLT